MNKLGRILISGASFAILSLLPLHAGPWQVLDPRAAGMGGAHVAIAEGPIGSYWNPAGQAQEKNTSGLQLPVMARAEFTGRVIEGANDLNALSAECNTSPPGPGCTQGAVDNALTKLNDPSNGLLGDVATGVLFKLGRFTVFINDFVSVGGNPEMDLLKKKANLVDCPNAADCVNKNDSKVVLQGVSMLEFGLSYGQELLVPGLYVGASVKGISGKVGYHEFLIVQEDPGSSSVLSKFDRNSARSFQPSLDVGALVDLGKTLSLPFRPRAGITARNINNPKFGQPDAAKAAGVTGDFSVNGQVRAGGAISLTNFWHVAADMDLTQNVGPLDGYRSRMFGLGTELNLVNLPAFNLPLRFGIAKNIADPDSKLSLTAGIGLNLLHVRLDLGGSWSTEKTTFQSEGAAQTVPQNFSVGGQLALLFGGGED